MDDELQKKDEELSASLKELQKKATIWKVGVGISVAFFVLCMFLDLGLVCLVGMVGLIICGSQATKYGKQIKSSVGDNILQQAMEEVFEDVYYSPFDHINSFDIDASGFDFSYDKIEGSDFINATYKGLHVMMSDVDLIEIDHDSDGHDSEHSVFRGLWMICDFGKELSADVQVMERGKLGQMLGKGGIKTENEAFNKQFKIKSDSQEDAFYILTPHMMEYIQQMDEKAKAKTNISFKRGGKMHLALNSGRDNFEVKGGMSDANKIREQFVAELHQITDVIDDLRVTDSIFKK